jgi:hypothetical protein
VSCEQAAAKELIDYAETEEERNALKQQHRALLRQMVQMLDFDVGQAAPTVGAAAEPVVAAQATVGDE